MEKNKSTETQNHPCKKTKSLERGWDRCDAQYTFQSNPALVKLSGLNTSHKKYSHTYVCAALIGFAVCIAV